MHYTLSGRDIVSESFDGDCIALDLASGRYFSFTDSGSALWQAVTSGIDVDALIASGGTAGWALAAPDFVSELRSNGLIIPAAAGAPAELLPIILDRLSEAREPPALSAFDDLADLFVADPIHDVDEEAGWPLVKQA